MGRTITTENDVRKAWEAVPPYPTRLPSGLGGLHDLPGQPFPLDEKGIRGEMVRRYEYALRRAASQTADNYTDKLLKYIPAESVALYLTLKGEVVVR
jgi:hypothetical protein